MQPGSPLDIEEVTFQLAAETPQPNVEAMGGVEAEGSGAEDDVGVEEQDDVSELSESPQDIESHPGRDRPRKIQKVSRYGTRFPSIPSTTMKSLATRFARSTGRTRSKLNKECMNAIEQASDWFFEQIGDDLRTYSDHAGRKTIDETDVVALMRR